MSNDTYVPFGFSDKPIGWPGKRTDHPARRVCGWNFLPYRGRDFFVTTFVEPDQRKEWLGPEYTYDEARRTLLTNWRVYADQFSDNHGPSV